MRARACDSRQSDVRRARGSGRLDARREGRVELAHYTFRRFAPRSTSASHDASYHRARRRDNDRMRRVRVRIFRSDLRFISIGA